MTDRVAGIAAYVEEAATGPFRERGFAVRGEGYNKLVRGPAEPRWRPW